MSEYLYPHVKEKQSFLYLHLCQGGGLQQRPSWSSAPSSLRSDRGLASSGLESRRGHRGHRRGNRLQREKDRNGLAGEEEKKDTRKTDGDNRGRQKGTRV